MIVAVVGSVLACIVVIIRHETVFFFMLCIGFGLRATGLVLGRGDLFNQHAVLVPYFCAVRQLDRGAIRAVALAMPIPHLRAVGLDDSGAVKAMQLAMSQVFNTFIGQNVQRAVKEKVHKGLEQIFHEQSKIF